MSTHCPLSYVETACAVQAIQSTNWAKWRDHAVELQVVPVLHGWQLGDSNTLMNYGTYATYWPPLRPYKCSCPINPGLRKLIEALGLVANQVSYFAQVLASCASRYSIATPRYALPECSFMESVDVLPKYILEDVKAHICLGDNEAFDCIGAWLCAILVGNASRRNTVHAAVSTNLMTTDSTMAMYTERSDALLADITSMLPATTRLQILTSTAEAYENRRSTWVVTLTSYRKKVHCAASEDAA